VASGRRKARGGVGTRQLLHLGVFLHDELNKAAPELALIGELWNGGVLEVDLLQVLEIREGDRETLEILVFHNIQLLKAGQLASCTKKKRRRRSHEWPAGSNEERERERKKTFVRELLQLVGGKEELDERLELPDLGRNEGDLVGVEVEFLHGENEW